MVVSVFFAFPFFLVVSLVFFPFGFRVFFFRLARSDDVLDHDLGGLFGPSPQQVGPLRPKATNGCFCFCFLPCF